MLTETEFTRYAQRYIDTVFRVAINCLRSRADAEDVTQEVFLKLLKEKKPFQSEEHVKAWLIRVAVNQCRNVTRSKWWRSESFEEYAATLSFDNPAHSDLFYAVMDLPEKYRLPIYLHYYEEYDTREVGALLHLPKNTVCSRLKRGRELLKTKLTEVEDYV